MASSDNKFEYYSFARGSCGTLKSPNIWTFTPDKQKSWPKYCADAQQNAAHVIHNVPKDLVLSESKKSGKTIVLDFHNVFDSDIVSFVKQCQTWRNQGHEVYVCSFVGRGGYLHAELLAVFSDPRIQQVLNGLWVVFDRAHLLKGKGQIIKKLFTPETNCIYFVDDGPENLENVHETLKGKDINVQATSCNTQIVHYVAVPSTRKSYTPQYAKRIGDFKSLVTFIQ
jgi:hypothetical protein